MRPEVRPSLNNREMPADADWLTRDQIVHFFGISYDLVGKLPASEVPRVAAGKSHIYHRPSINSLLLKVARLGVSLKDYCEQGATAPRARKRGRPRKMQNAEGGEQ